jgi:hypothetical protein
VQANLKAPQDSVIATTKKPIKRLSIAVTDKMKALRGFYFLAWSKAHSIGTAYCDSCF